MEQEQNVFDIKLYAAEKASLKRLAGKYGIAMIILVLNNTFAPYLFLRIYSFFASTENLPYTSLLALNAVSAYLLPVVVLFFLFREEIRAFVPDKGYKPFRGEAFCLFTAGMTTGIFGTLLTKLINMVVDKLFGTGEIKDAFAGMEPQNMAEFGVFAFFICIIAPIAEEIMFRSLLLKPLRAYGDLTAVLVSGILFGLYHGNFDQFAYATLLGLFFSTIAVKYNSIVPVTILHAANNIIVTCASDLGGACADAPQQVKDICEKIVYICGSLSAILAFLGFFLLIICIARKCFVLRTVNRYLSNKEALAAFVSTPLAIIGILVMFTLFIN